MPAKTPKTLPNTTAQVVQAVPHRDLVAAQAAFDAIIPRFTAARSDVDDARTALDAANASENGVRGDILIELAKASIAGDWSFEHAQMGVKASLKAYEATHNTLPSTLTTFAAECYRAIHPKARDHVESAFSDAAEAWEAEGARIKAAQASALAAKTKYIADPEETPLREAFKRKYHMVAGTNGMLAAHASNDDERNMLANDPVMLADTIVGSEKRDEKRAARAIAKVVATIEDVANEFPSPRWDTVVKFLGGLNAKTLVAFRDAQVRQQRMEQRERPAKRNASPAPASVTADAVNAASDDLLAE